MLNPNIKIAEGKGIDLPVLYVYLAGRISGDVISDCICWRHNIIKYYMNYKVEKDGIMRAYPIAFLCPLNSGEASSIDEKGLKSNISSNLIYDKDILSIKHSHAIIANMDDFFEEGIEDLMLLDKKNNDILDKRIDYKKEFYKLQERIANRRENLGTIMEVGMGLLLGKPIFLIVPEKRKKTFINHPFTKRVSEIVTSVEELIERELLITIYKSISGATYQC